MQCTVRTVEFIYHLLDTKNWTKRPCSLFCVVFNRKNCFMCHYHLRRGAIEISSHHSPCEQSHRRASLGQLLTSSTMAFCSQPKQSDPSLQPQWNKSLLQLLRGACRWFWGPGPDAGVCHSWISGVGTGAMQTPRPGGHAASGRR